MRALSVMDATVEVKTGTVSQAKARYNIGRDSVIQLAEDAGAIVHIGRRILINFSKVDAYMDSISQ